MVFRHGEKMKCLVVRIRSTFRGGGQSPTRIQGYPLEPMVMETFFKG